MTRRELTDEQIEARMPRKAGRTASPAAQAVPVVLNGEEAAQEVAAVFRHAGIRAAAVWGTMPKSERQRTLAQLSSGAIEVVTNCNVLTEGFDEPRIDSVHAVWMQLHEDLIATLGIDRLG